MHMVVTGNIQAAIEDWRDQFAEFHRSTRHGVLKDGRRIKFLSVDWPEVCFGQSFDSFEMHPSAQQSPHFERIEALLKGRMR